MVCRAGVSGASGKVVPGGSEQADGDMRVLCTMI